MKDSFLALVEIQKAPLGPFTSDFMQQTITTWLTNQLNKHTNDACAKVSAQAFKIISCPATAHML